ncbi:MAG TPA: putative Ig domain-containing protein, partial [Humisphaera sp.]
TVRFAFAAPARVLDVQLVDIARGGGTITARDAAGKVIVRKSIPGVGQNTVQTVAIDATGVSRLEVTLAESGGIARLTFAPSPAVPPAVGVTLALDPLYDTDPEGDNVTALPAADLLGTTTPGASVALYRKSAPNAPIGTATADADGAYEFPLVEQNLGPNPFVAKATKDGATKTAELTVVRIAPDVVNHPPEITTSPVTTATAQASAGGRLVVAANTAALADAAFDADAESAGRFAGNLVAYLAGKQSPKVLVYSADPGVAGTRLAASMAVAGVDWTVSTAGPFTAAALSAYDAVLVGGAAVPTQALADYLAGGGNVFLALGADGFASPAAEAAAWNPLLQPLGLSAQGTSAAAAGAATVPPGAHPVLAGVGRVAQRVGQAVADVDPLDDLGTTLLADRDGRTVLAAYDPAFSPARGGYRYDVDATDPDGDPVRYGLGLKSDGTTAGPAGMWIDPATGVVRWAPRPDQAGAAYQVTVVAADDRGGADDQAFTITVAAAAPNRPPVFTTAPSTRLPSGGSPYAYDADAVDPDADAIAFSLVSGPAGMQVDPRTGVVTWSAPAGTSGPVPVTIRAADGRGGSADQSWSITSDATVVPQPPTDLTITDLHSHDLAWDAQALTVSGTVEAVVKNAGANPVVTPFEVAFFEDRNHDGDYDDGTDGLLGVTTVTDALAAGQSKTVTATLSGNVLFRGNLVWGYVDSSKAVAETDEGNNYLDGGRDCVVTPRVGTFDPVVQFQA